ncbi:hypothetical protein MLD38_038286 [Melastoma candidum]|uniref:Uncharacterized protein n=1 Tax=Melastoma candidum TaxID=119954 RepID=A0ACB9KZL9_9MYRT|nr:hypothetical protein MLD38_038286 [Melastoma candidum]
MASSDSSSAPLLLATVRDTEEAPGDAVCFDSFDEMVEWCVSGFSWRRFLKSLLVSFAWFFDGQQVCISDFTDTEPSWHCTSSACSASSSICSLQDGSWAWDTPSYTSTISEWALECSGSFITGLSTTSFYFGCLVGGVILSTLGDSSLGRKKLLIISCLVMSLAAFASSFSINLWMYSSLRFVSGVGRASIGTCAIVLATEIVGKDSRGLVGMIGLFIGTFGLLTLPGIAYLLRNASWRFLYLSTSIPPIIYCFVAFFLVGESPKWLFLRGHKLEALDALRKLSPEKYSQVEPFVSSLMIKHNEANINPYSSLRELFTKRWALARIMKVMAIGFGVGMGYYGILLGVEDLGLDKYLTVTLNVIVALPSYLTSYLLIQKCHRRPILLTLTTGSGALSIICAFLRSGTLKVAAELSSFFCVCSSYNVLLIYTVELFPLWLRNSATSILRQAIILGVLLDPTLISAGQNIWYLTYLVFGLAVMCCGLAVIFLPEMKGVSLADNLDMDNGD